MLAEPDSEQQRHSLALSQLIQQSIHDHDGWIGFDRYMQMALYQPGLGYYSAGAEKFGAGGDFVTAPMLGKLFAGCLARQCAEVLSRADGQSIVEFGAGDGSLAAGLLRALEELGSLPAEYLIVETSADLAARQQQRINQLTNAGLVNRVKWLSTMPESINGLVIGNELLDAMPCKRFELGADGRVVELGVTCEQQRFQWRNGAALDLPFNLEDCDAGYQSEWLQQAEAWVATVAGKLERGTILLFDYGFPSAEFYHPDRRNGTMMCHYRHHAHSEPFFWPGLQDITCHVDFSAIARAAEGAGLTVTGYCNQGEFLVGSGLLDIVQNAMPADPADVKMQLALAAEVKKLTLPHEMGELFKVIALGHDGDVAPSGFRRNNKRHRLFND